MGLIHPSSYQHTPVGLNNFSEQKGTGIDLFLNGDQNSYSFVLMLISLISLIAMGKIVKNI